MGHLRHIVDSTSENSPTGRQMRGEEHVDTRPFPMMNVPCGSHLGKHSVGIPAAMGLNGCQFQIFISYKRIIIFYREGNKIFISQFLRDTFIELTFRLMTGKVYKTYNPVTTKSIYISSSAKGKFYWFLWPI